LSASPITLEVRALERLDLEGLRAEWRRRYGPPPKLRSPDTLRRLLAWRIQAAVMGGLSPQTRRRLASEAAARPSDGLTPGTRLSREWKGVAHEVLVTGDGFVHADRTYPSLSAAATAIAGSRWNGPRFFGLRAGAGE
jgi:hypothetical protein